jgi:hypothetical protein
MSGDVDQVEEVEHANPDDAGHKMSHLKSILRNSSPLGAWSPLATSPWRIIEKTA